MLVSPIASAPETLKLPCRTVPEMISVPDANVDPWAAIVPASTAPVAPDRVKEPAITVPEPNVVSTSLEPLAAIESWVVTTAPDTTIRPASVETAIPSVAPTSVIWISAVPSWRTSILPRVDMSFVPPRTSWVSSPMVTLMALSSVDVNVKIPFWSTDATTPCSLVFWLMDEARAPSASFSWTVRAPMLTPLMANEESVVPAVTLLSVEDSTTAVALMPRMSLSLFKASATAPRLFSLELL